MEDGVSCFDEARRDVFGVDSMLFMSETRDLVALRGFFSLSTLSNLSGGSDFSTLIGVSSTTIGDLGLVFETGSERMLEKDMTPAARLGVLVAAGALDDGAGDSVRPKAGSAIEVAPFVPELCTEECRRVGEAILGGLLEGLMEPAVEA